MEIFAGKTPAERNKMIAAIALGVLALFALYMAFGPSFRTKAVVNVTPIASPSVNPNNRNNQTPNKQGDVLSYMVPVPTVFNVASAPETGRNIFAFYEPPAPTPWQPTPPPPAKTPSPSPTPPYQIAYVMPQSVYAGTAGFRLEVNGDKFTPDTRVYFNQSQMPTTFVSAQRMVAEIPAAMISNEGPKTIMVQSIDGKSWSNQVMLTAQAAPKPQFQYIGLIARKRYNNDTAYFQESGKQTPTSARLNDVVGGRFRLVSMSSDETVVEDVNLGFRYKLQLVKASTTTASSGGRQDFPTDVYRQYDPQQYQQQFPQQVQGIPPGVPQYIPPRRQQPRPQTDKDKEKKDVDDNDDEDGDN